MLTEQEHIDRLGMITASPASKIIGKPRNSAELLSKEGQTYIKKIVGEYLAQDWDEINTPAMDWGNYHESFALKHFEANMQNLPGYQGAKLTKGFVFKNPMFPDCSCTPDGMLIDFEEGVEVKCPQTIAAHTDYLLIENQADLKRVKKEYYWQIMFCLLITGYKKWYFVSYHPKHFSTIDGIERDNRLYYIPIYPDPDEFDLLRQQIDKARKYKYQLISRIDSNRIIKN